MVAVAFAVVAVVFDAAMAAWLVCVSAVTTAVGAVASVVATVGVTVGVMVGVMVGVVVLVTSVTVVGAAAVEVFSAEFAAINPPSPAITATLANPVARRVRRAG